MRYARKSTMRTMRSLRKHARRMQRRFAGDPIATQAYRLRARPAWGRREHQTDPVRAAYFKEYRRARTHVPGVSNRGVVVKIKGKKRVFADLEWRARDPRCRGDPFAVSVGGFECVPAANHSTLVFPGDPTAYPFHPPKDEDRAEVVLDFMYGNDR